MRTERSIHLHILSRVALGDAKVESEAVAWPPSRRASAPKALLVFANPMYGKRSKHCIVGTSRKARPQQNHIVMSGTAHCSLLVRPSLSAGLMFDVRPRTFWRCRTATTDIHVCYTLFYGWMAVAKVSTLSLRPTLPYPIPYPIPYLHLVLCYVCLRVGAAVLTRPRLRPRTPFTLLYFTLDTLLPYSV